MFPLATTFEVAIQRTPREVCLLPLRQIPSTSRVAQKTACRGTCRFLNQHLTNQGAATGGWQSLKEFNILLSLLFFCFTCSEVCVTFFFIFRRRANVVGRHMESDGFNWFLPFRPLRVTPCTSERT